ncbi:MAG: glutathione S-transferase family protein [Pseudomonadota bacterium]
MSDLSLVIGNKNYSSWSLRPWFLMKYFEIPFSEIRVPLSQETTEKALRPLSPTLKVPVLIHRDLKIWDSLAICEYISENFLSGKGWPRQIEARAIARSISAEMHSGFFDIRNQLPMNCRKRFDGFKISPEARSEINRVEEIWSQCRERHGTSGPWLFGKFTIADCMFAPVALRFITYGVELNDFSSQYINRVQEHPAIVDWIGAARLETEIIQEFESDCKLPEVP